LFALTWAASAPTGFINSGLFTLSAEWWSGDPFAGGSFLQNALDETAAFTATVSQPIGPSVPEPRTIPVLIALALLFLRFVRGRSPRPRRLPVTLP
jgi:hypothetical protein